ncbi:endopeptidase La [Salvia divinorum]|uniref:Endopeptidase La n=1 Tax=Salvia divinorum TaxID=28513 RepID=A0ABD1HIJ9_SALDI
MLDSVDVKARLSKATELVDRRLQSNRVTEEIRQKAESQLSMSQKEFLLKAQPPSYPDRQTADTVATPGVSVGLVSSAYGIEGEVEFIEATAMAGKGDLHATGQLDDATKESAQIAMTWVRARAMELNLVTAAESNLLEGRDIHIKFPPGAVLDLNR